MKLVNWQDFKTQMYYKVIQKNEVQKTENASQTKQKGSVLHG
jgi:hypothetical protein